MLRARRAVAVARAFARRSTFRAALVGALVVTFAHAAVAQTEPIRLEYTGAPECPNADEFARGVFQRTSRAHLANNEGAARTFVIVIEHAGAGFSGRLAVREAGETTTAREVKGAGCAEVAEALALATSLAIDPNASLTAEPATTATTPLADVKPPPAEKRDTSAEGKPGSDAAKGPAWEAALGPGVALAVGPRPAFGGAARVGFSAKNPSAAVSSLGLELSLLMTPNEAVETAASRFWFYFARPELCSFGIGSPSVAVLPCAGVELGAVTARGSEIADAATRTRFWAALDVGPRLRANLSETWFFEIDARLLVPLVRYEFVFRDPDTTVHRIPPLAAAFGAKFGARFR